MLSDAQRENISTFFHAMDATADGRVTLDDAVMRADQMCAALAPDSASQRHRDLQAAYRHMWAELQRFADTDDDGAVTLEEFLDATDRAMQEDPEYVDGAVLIVTRALFAAMDADGDGNISVGEYTPMFGALHLTDEVASASFATLDRNADGVIGESELVDAMRELFHGSESSEAFGSHALS